MSTEILYQILTGHQSDVNWVDFNGHRKLVSCSNDRTIRLWETNDQQYFDKPKLSTLIGHEYGVNCVRYSPFGTIIASASTDGCIILWNSQNGEQVLKMMHESRSAIRVCCFSPSSALLASGADDETLVVWDISTRTRIKTLYKHDAKITGCSFTPDSTYMISCSSSGDLKLWDTKYGNVSYLMTYEVAHDLGVLGCDFSSQYEVNVADGPLQSFYLLATCGNDDLVKLWHISGGLNCSIRLSHKLIGHDANVNCCKFSMDGSLLASAGGDKMVIVWDPKIGQMIHRLDGHKRYVTSCAFSDDNKLLASGSNDQTIIVWHLNKIKTKHFNIKISINPQQQQQQHSNESIHMNNHQQNKKIQNKSYQSSSLSSTNDIFKKKFPTEWNSDDVCDWLTSLGLERYTKIFRKHEIDGPELLHLTHDALLTNLRIEPLGHRNKILRSSLFLKNPLWLNTDETEKERIQKPSEFCCPIIKEIMNDPVVASDGHSYERTAIQKWISDGNVTSPLTNEVLDSQILTPNYNLRSLIRKFRSTIPTIESND
ncbi:WD repeat, SAM and U-box domain-containing protein 1-like [Dermatophagoides pteronyssinus]|uniref:WD repeat, SAM and U-box domain-containing protein 1-like n=1 Tax=Dermatophagoides pteronyssinus TaxID=6956 RepID=UPI003F661D86